MRSPLPNITISGYHYYPGTMRMTEKEIDADLRAFCGALERLKEFDIAEVEYGAGIGIDYYGSNNPFTLANIIGKKLSALSSRFKITFEVGRLLTFNVGTYITRIVDIKSVAGRCEE